MIHTVYINCFTMNIFLVLTMISSSMSLPSDRVKGLLARIPNTCATRTGESCVFPFIYQGVEHYHCTYAYSPTAWCATMTDSQGVVVTNRWGDCETNALSSCQEEQISLQSCTTQSGPYPSQPCVFPFRYNGVTYTSCTTQDKSQAWCSTTTTLAGTHIPGYFGYCPSSCPVLRKATAAHLVPRILWTVTPVYVGLMAILSVQAMTVAPLLPPPLPPPLLQLLPRPLPHQQPPQPQPPPPP